MLPKCGMLEKKVEKAINDNFAGGPPMRFLLSKSMALRCFAASSQPSRAWADTTHAAYATGSAFYNKLKLTYVAAPNLVRQILLP